MSFLSYDALPRDADDAALQVPLGAPTVAVEILSPDDRRADVEHKIATYLRAGTSAVLVVDPTQQTIAVHGDDAALLRAGDVLTHDALPGFTLDVAELFARAKR